jgi:CRISPR-associated protein (TIGR02584 family)
MPEPHELPRRVLLVAAGLSPQVVTETVYALAVVRRPRWVPTEIQLVTTLEGAERARLALLSGEPGWFARLLRDYELPMIEFGPERIAVIEGRTGPLDDIRSDEDNRRAADGITELVRKLTLDPESALHVSIAGGRKTMGFYLGYALSLFGREQDRLSHVLVPAAVESHPDFYYPSPASRVIFTAPPDSRPIDAAKAAVTLAEIPFVRLRHGLPMPLLEGRTSFGAAVEAAQRSVGPPQLRFHSGERKVLAAGVEVKMRPAEMAFYAMMARRVRRDLPAVACPALVEEERALASAYLTEYRALLGEMGADDRTARALRGGMDKDFFLERKSRVNKALRAQLGARGEAYCIGAAGRRPETRYRIGLRQEEIGFAPDQETG